MKSLLKLQLNAKARARSLEPTFTVDPRSLKLLEQGPRPLRLVPQNKALPCGIGDQARGARALLIYSLQLFNSSCLGAPQMKTLPGNARRTYGYLNICTVPLCSDLRTKARHQASGQFRSLQACSQILEQSCAFSLACWSGAPGLGVNKIDNQLCSC